MCLSEELHPKSNWSLMSALRNDSDKQGMGDVLNYIIYQNTLEIMHVQGGKAHKKDLCKGGKMQSAFFEGLPCLKGTADCCQCHTQSTCSSCPGPQARPGSLQDFTQLQQDWAACEQLLGVWASPRAGAKPGNDRGMRTWASRARWQLISPVPARPAHPVLSLWCLCTQQLLNWGRQCWALSWGHAHKGTAGDNPLSSSVPSSCNNPPKAPVHSSLSTPGPCRNPSWSQHNCLGTFQLINLEKSLLILQRTTPNQIFWY